MLEIKFHEFPVLLTERLLLREIKPDDAAEIFFLRSNRDVMQYIDRPPAQSVEEADRYIQQVGERFTSSEWINWAISLKNEPRLIGTIGYWRIDTAHHRAEIGYVLHPAQQGKGIMQEAMEAVLKYAFDILKFHSIEANVNPANAASIRLLEKNKFVREGFFRENYFYNGKFLDSAVYSLLTPHRAG